MTDMIGMDVEAVRRISSGLRQKAGDIRAIEARVDAIVGQINGSWQGNRARQFVGDWHGHHRAALLLLADRVDGLGQSALNNAAEQESASAGGGRSGGPGSFGGGGGGSWAGVAPAPVWGLVSAGAAAALPNAKKLLDWSAKFSDNKYSVGRYTASWNKILSATDGLKINGHRLVPEDLLRFKRSPVTHLLNEHQNLLKGGQAVVGKASGVASVVDSGSAAYFAFKSGDVYNGVADGVNAATRAVDVSPAGKVPIVHAGTFAVRAWAEVERAATNPDIDWSSKGITQTLSASPGEWATAIKETFPQFKDIVLKKIW
jgi:uncharacterized protein YukE